MTQAISCFCHACGSGIDPRAEICPKCGVRQRATVFASGRSRTTAAVLALFLGGLGGHKFYLGKPFQGLLYLVFCWTFLPAVFAFIEFIILLSMNDQTFARKFGT